MQNGIAMELTELKLIWEIQYYRHRMDVGLEEYFDAAFERSNTTSLFQKAKLTVRLLDISKRNRFNDYWLQKRLRQLKGAEHFEYRVFEKSGFALRRLVGVKKK